MPLVQCIKAWSGINALRPLSLRRCYSSSSDFIILSPKQAGLVKSKPKGLIRKPTQSQSRPLDILQLSESEAEPIVSAIHSQRPETSGITSQRFSQITRELLKGFKKSHLEDYLQVLQLGGTKVKRMSKAKMVDFIMKEAWHCFVKEDDFRGTAVENIIELSEPEFVLALARNGRLLREWTKSGSKVAILPARCQIIVTSSPKTFEWINASLEQYLESISWKELDLTELNKLVSLDSSILAVIQRLTDSYFQKGSDPNIIRAYSAGRERDKYSAFELIKRLLLRVSQSSSTYQKWRPSKWWFDVNQSNISNYRFIPFNDTDSQEWIDRTKQWLRWESIKVKQETKLSQELAEPVLKPLIKPEFSADPFRSIPENLSLDAQITSVVSDLLQPLKPSLNGESVSTTLTVTPGYILHLQNQSSSIPNAGMEKTFSSNVPFITNFASGLQLFSGDVHHDESSQEPVPNEPQSSADDNSWENLLKFDEDPVEDNTNRVFVNRHKDLDLTSNLRLVQMKFVPDPDQPNASNYPPIEAWGNLPSSRATETKTLEQVPRLVAVPLESSSYVSLPQSKTDLKITLTQTYPVQISEEIEKYFLEQCSFGKLGPIFIKPTIQVNWQGHNVTYRCLETNYVILAELEFQGQLLQLSQVEGGKLGGRRIEASLISHFTNSDEPSVSGSADTENSTLQSANASANILNFVNSLQ